MSEYEPYHRYGSIPYLLHENLPILPAAPCGKACSLRQRMSVSSYHNAAGKNTPKSVLPNIPNNATIFCAY